MLVRVCASELCSTSDPATPQKMEIHLPKGVCVASALREEREACTTLCGAHVSVRGSWQSLLGTYPISVNVVTEHMKERTTDATAGTSSRCRTASSRPGTFSAPPSRCCMSFRSSSRKRVRTCGTRKRHAKVTLKPNHTTAPATASAARHRPHVCLYCRQRARAGRRAAPVVW